MSIENCRREFNGMLKKALTYEGFSIQKLENVLSYLFSVEVKVELYEGQYQLMLHSSKGRKTIEAQEEKYDVAEMTLFGTCDYFPMLKPIGNISVEELQKPVVW